MGHSVNNDKLVEIKALVHKNTEWVVLRRRVEGTFAVWGEGISLDHATSDFFRTQTLIREANSFESTKEMWDK